MKHFFLIIALLLPFCSFGQLIENFDGPYIDSSYPWKGDSEHFIINDRGELQLNGKPFRYEKPVLYLSSVFLPDNEWRCKVRNEGKGTVDNHFRIYIWCRQPDWEDPDEAVFVRLGYKENNVALCYQERNRNPVVLFQGRKLFEGPREVEIRVTTSVSGECAVYSKLPEEADFYLEGICDLPVSSRAAGYFMIGIQHSSKTNRDKYVDDIYIKNFTPEGEPGEEEKETFELVDIVQVNEYEIEFHFNQEVETYDSVCLSDIGEADVVWSSEDGLTLTAEWENPMEKEKEYTLTYLFFDKEDNSCGGKYAFVSLYGVAGGESPEEPQEPEEPENPEGPDPVIPQPGEPGSVVIHEIMADPKGLTLLPETEYVELYNASGEEICLKDWSFQYGNSNPVLLDDYLFPSGSYLLLYREGREIVWEESGDIMPLAKFPAQLANAGKELFLWDAYGNLIDEVVYGKAKPGVSWERSGEDWHLSSDDKGGTPGAPNSFPVEEPENPEEPEGPELPQGPPVEPNDFIFNELLPEPYPDGSEYIELYNRSGRALYLSGLSVAVRKADGSLGTRYPLSEVQRVLFPGEFVVLTKDAGGVLDFYRVDSYDTLYELKIPVLTNTGMNLVLLRTKDEVIIDELSYSSKWHAPSVKDRKGIALERIDPDKPTQDPGNWTSASATAGYGTPGCRNSQYGQVQPPGGETGIRKPEYRKETGLYLIRYYLDQPGYNCYACIYDISGRRMAEISNNKLLGTEGELLWDGTGAHGGSLKAGPYILYLKLYHSTGKVEEYKEVFLVY